MNTDDVVEHLHRLPGWAGTDLVVTPIETGLTNSNFRVDRGGSSYVVRIPGERTELLGIDRVGEADAARRAAQLGIGPGIVGELPGVGTLVTEFVEGEPADREGLTAPGVLERLAQAIRRFHDSPPIAARFPIFRVIEWHARDAVANGGRLPELHDRLRDVADKIEGAIGRGADDRLCHNDLLPANVLVGQDRLWLIDFEYAGMNHAVFDLANLSVNGAFDAGDDERLLTAYDDDVSDRRIAQLALMKIMSEIREGMWAVVQQVISTLDHVDFVAYADERLQHCLELSASPEFPQWLSAASTAESSTRR